jgi:hypothetical protein
MSSPRSEAVRDIKYHSLASLTGLTPLALILPLERALLKVRFVSLEVNLYLQARRIRLRRAIVCASRATLSCPLKAEIIGRPIADFYREF